MVSGRKGGVFMKMEITGKAAHSGGKFTEGISAIEELARKITALHAITDLPRGTTVNVGLVSGGQTVNTVAPWAKCEIDLRYVTPRRPRGRDGARSRASSRPRTCRAPARRSRSPASSIRWCSRPRTRRCSSTIQACAGDLAIKVDGEFSGGCADSGFTAAVGTPTICAVGPIGSDAHTPHEYLEVNSLVPRAQTLALAVARLG